MSRVTREIKIRAYVDIFHANLRFNTGFYSWYDVRCLPYLWQMIEDGDAFGMQYVGICDKNQKEIYEYDVVKVKMYNGLNEQNEKTYAYEYFVVIWKTERCSFELMESSGDSFSFNRKEDIEVVGNIFETKDYLYFYEKVFREK